MGVSFNGQFTNILHKAACVQISPRERDLVRKVSLASLQREGNLRARPPNDLGLNVLERESADVRRVDLEQQVASLHLATCMARSALRHTFNHVGLSKASRD